MMRVPGGIVTSSPGMLGVVAFTSRVVNPAPSSGRLMALAVSSFGR